MMMFATVDPRAKLVEYGEANELTEVYPRVGLKRKRVEFGILGRLASGGGVVNYVVNEFGWYEPASAQSYCLIGSRLIAGACVIFQSNEAGETVDLDRRLIIKPVWLADAAAVEEVIALGLVPRPRFVIDGEVIWQWPEPAPSQFADRVER